MTGISLERNESDSYASAVFSSVPVHGQAVIQGYEELLTLLRNLPNSVLALAKRHEDESFVACRTHMFAGKCEVEALKRAEDKYNVAVIKDDYIQSLEKDLEWYMSECLRLDELCKAFKDEGDIWLAKSEALKDDLSFIETQVTETQRRVHVLEEAIYAAKEESKKALESTHPPEPIKLPQRPSHAPVTHRARHLQDLKRELRSLRSTEAKDHRDRIEMETVFIVAAREARKSLAQRRQLGKAESPVIDGLLESEQVLTKLYHAIFPYRRI